MSEQQHYRGLFSRPVPLLAFTAATAASFWCFCVGSFSWHELAVGAVVVLLTTSFARLMFASTRLAFDPRWRDIAQVRLIPGNLVQDSFAVLRVLARSFSGKAPEAAFLTAPFAAKKDDPVRLQRTVLAVTYMTATPNSIVIGVDPSRSLILYHQLERTEIPKLAQKLGAPR